MLDGLKKPFLGHNSKTQCVCLCVLSSIIPKFGRVLRLNEEPVYLKTKTKAKPNKSHLD